jgi:hypothetical protein
MPRFHDVTDLKTRERKLVPFTPEEEAAADAAEQLEASRPPAPAPRDIWAELDDLKARVTALEARGK